MFVNFVCDIFAVDRTALVRSAEEKSDEAIIARENSAFYRLAPLKFPPLIAVNLKSALSKSAFEKSAF